MVRSVWCVLLAVAIGMFPAALASTVAAQEDQPAAEAPPPAEDAGAAPAADATDAAPAPSSPDLSPDWWTWRSPPDVGKAIEAEFAYGRFWQARRAAAAALDADGEVNLRLVEDGDMLKRDLDMLAKLRAEGHAEIMQVEHNPILAYADDQQYVLYDDMVNGTYLVDAKTRAPIGDHPGEPKETLHYAFLLKKIPDPTSAVGFWVKVVDSRHLIDQ